jgi:riboflavin kinase/FMN adenylyltransferase
MEVIYDIHKFIPGKKTAIALGRFDGVHVGHRALLERAVAYARENDLMSVCFSFREETYPGAPARGVLTTEKEKLDLIREIGIDTLLHPPFAPPVIDIPHDRFLHTYLINQWKARMIAVGYDFHFGKNRIGDVSFLKSEAEKRGVEVDILRPVTSEGEVVKATIIRGLLRDGHLEKANRLLGRPYSVIVAQVPGRRLGSKIGFPTLNFNWPEGKVPVKYGVYAVRVGSFAFRDDPSSSVKPIVDGVANFGVRPTVDEGARSAPLLEVHLLDPMKMIDILADPPSQDTDFTVEFLVFMRNEVKFDSLEALKAAIDEDVKKAREIMGEIG